MEYNLKVRELYCPYCKVYSKSDKTDVKCKVCGHGLITVIYSLEDQRLTGEIDVKKD